MEDTETTKNKEDDYEKVNELLDAYLRDRKIETRNLVVEASEEILVSATKRYLGKGEPFDDLKQEGSKGLIKAVEKFDPGKGVKFSTYATGLIKGEIKHYFRDKNCPVKVSRVMKDFACLLKRKFVEFEASFKRSPTVQELTVILSRTEKNVSEEKVEIALEFANSFYVVSLDEILSYGNEDPANLIGYLKPDFDETGFDEVIERKIIGDILNNLTDEEKLIIMMGFYDQESFADIARKLNIPYRRVATMKDSALKKIKKDLSQVNN